MKLLTMATSAVILFFYFLLLPFAFFISCFKLALRRTDIEINKGCDVINEALERRKK